MRSELLEPKELRFEASNLYYEALKRQIGGRKIMIKTLKNLLKQDKERYTVPRKVQDVIPIRRIWKDGLCTCLPLFKDLSVYRHQLPCGKPRGQGADVPCLLGAAEQSGFRGDDEDHHQQPQAEPGKFRAINLNAHAGRHLRCVFYSI